MSFTPAKTSVIICTRNRAHKIRATLTSVLANTYHDFEVILVDQSTNTETEQAVREFCADPRFRYLPSATQGLGRARNIGLKEAQGEIVVATDDDCIVPPNWVEVMTRAFAHDPRVAIVFCNVLPLTRPSAPGWTPTYVRCDSILVQTPWAKNYARGIGAGMAMRRDVVLAIGGFDESLGAGARFASCEDRDIAIRALVHKFWVYETPEVAVVHDGFRDARQLRELTKRDFTGMGAACIKLVKCGQLHAALAYTYDFVVVVLWSPFVSLLRLKRPRGFGRLLFFCYGLMQGLLTPVDRRRMVYRLE